MKVVWDERESDIGHYKMWFETDDGQKLPDSEIWFDDYTCDYLKNYPYRNERYANVAFEWCWCHGWSHSECYKLDENLTLEQAKMRAVRWVAQRYIDNYESCLEAIKKLKPIAEWAEKELAKE